MKEEMYYFEGKLRKTPFCKNCGHSRSGHYISKGKWSCLVCSYDGNCKDYVEIKPKKLKEKLDGRG